MTTGRYPSAGLYGCVRTPGFGSWLIRVGTRSWANHVFITLDDRGTIAEAEPGGLRKAHLDEYEGYRCSLNLHEMYTPDQRQKVVDGTTALIGVPYDDLAIVNDGLEVLRVHWRWLIKAANSDHELMCSQAVAVVGAQAGFDWLCGRSAAVEVTPADLAKRDVMVPWQW
jgi:hypothetical protein